MAHRGRNTAIGIAGIAAALGAAGTAGVYRRVMKRPLPVTSGECTVHGLDSPVDIRRDRWGVPHVRASSRHDLWFGEGVAHGQDRLWQLELYRRSASGRISEVAGPEALPIDRLMRTLGLRRLALAEEAALPADVRAELDAYCAGVNASLELAPVLPAEFQILRIEFEPWRPADMLCAMKLLAFGLSTNWETELMRAELTREVGPEIAARLDPGYPRGNPVAITPGDAYAGAGSRLATQIDAVREQLGFAPAASGSNNWAVGPSRSASGGTLLAGDPHLPPSMPGIWHQIGLELGGRYARGASLPGAPGIFMGHNNDVAWAITNTMADVQDLFVERIAGDRYEFEGEWRDLAVEEEVIEVRGAEPERLQVRSTHHGPIVNSVLGADEIEPLALRFSALDFPLVGRPQLNPLDATSGAELVEAVSEHVCPVSNVVWADRHGDFGYQMIGRLPIRRGACPDLPKPGWTGEFEWDGYVPFGELPAVVNPEPGFVVTANNRIVHDDYEHHITSDYLDGARADRIERLIDVVDEHDLDSFQRMQTDLLSLPGLRTVKMLSRLAGREQRETRAIERLRSWDGRMTPDSVATTIYQAFTLRFAHEVARAALDDRDLAERFLDRSVSGFTNHITAPWRWQSHLLALWDEGDPALIGGRDWNELALDCLRRALDDLADRFGSDPDGWRWGRVHKLNFKHALGDANPLLGRLLNRELEAGGGQETVAQIACDPNDPYEAVWAPSWRMVIDMSDPESARWQSFTGQSGHPGSPHYDDLQRRWLRGEMQPMAGEAPWETLRLVPPV